MENIPGLVRSLAQKKPCYSTGFSRGKQEREGLVVDEALDSVGFTWVSDRVEELTFEKELEAVEKFLANNHIDTSQATNEHRTWIYLKS